MSAPSGPTPDPVAQAEARVAADPHDADAWLALAESRRRDHRRDADGAWHGLLAVHPRDRGRRLALADALWSARDLAGCAAVAEAGLRWGPTPALAERAARARAWLGDRDAVDAILASTRPGLGPAQVADLRLDAGDWEGAGRALLGAEDPDALGLVAERHLLLDQVDRAEALLPRLAGPVAHRLAGRVARRRGDLAGAIRAWTSGITAEDRPLDLLVLRAEARWRQGRLPEARRDLEHARTLHAGDHRSWLDVDAACAGRPEAARRIPPGGIDGRARPWRLQEGRPVLDADLPDHAQVDVVWTRLGAGADLGWPPERLAGDRPVLRLARATLASWVDDHAGVLVELAGLDHPDAVALRARVALARGDTASAVDDDGADPLLRVDRARAEGRLRDAVATLRPVLEARPDHATAWVVAADLLARAGRDQAFTAAWAQAWRVARPVLSQLARARGVDPEARPEARAGLVHAAHAALRGCRDPVVLSWVDRDGRHRLARSPRIARVTGA